MLRAGPWEEASAKARGVQRTFCAMAKVTGTSELVRKNKDRGVWAYGRTVTVTYVLVCFALFRIISKYTYIFQEFDVRVPFSISM